MGRFLVTYVLMAPPVARKHRLVQAPGPGLTVIFLTFLVLVQVWAMRQRILGSHTPPCHGRMCKFGP